jgi:hypothetical protein
MAKKQFQKMVKEWKDVGPKEIFEGKLIVFPIPSALGAFTGYKLSFILQGLFSHI